MQRTRVSRTAIAALILLGILIIVPTMYVVRERHRCEQRLVKLLCQTDYEVLLQACRDLSGRAAAGALKSKVYVLRRTLPGIARFRPDPEVASFPQAILDIDPVFVRIEGDGCVCVVLYPAPSQGVMACPADYDLRRHSLGNVELVPGLWFYDEQYNKSTHPDFVKHIDELISKGKEFQRGRTTHQASQSQPSN